MTHNTLPEPDTNTAAHYYDGEPAYSVELFRATVSALEAALANSVNADWHNEKVAALEAALSAAEAERDALRADAERWRYLEPRICWSFDGRDRTYYHRVTGRTDFTAAIDNACEGKE